MSLLHRIEITLKVKNEKNHVLKLLEKGDEIGFKYFTFNFDDYNRSKLNNSKETLEYIYSISNGPLEDIGRSVMVEVLDTSFCLRFFEYQYDYIEFSLSDFNTWKQGSLNEYPWVDYSRYIRVALQFSSDFVISNMQVNSL